MKKLPVIGLLIGLVAAGVAFLKHKKSEPEEQQDTNPPA